MSCWTPQVSVRAAIPEGATIAVLPVQGVGEVRLWLPFPRAACPVSGNPLLGVVGLRYRPGKAVLEVVSLHQRIGELARTPPEDARNVEVMAARIRREAVTAAGVAVQVELWLLIRPGPQIYCVRCG